MGSVPHFAPPSIHSLRIAFSVGGQRLLRRHLVGRDLLPQRAVLELARDDRPVLAEHRVLARQVEPALRVGAGVALEAPPGETAPRRPCRSRERPHSPTSWGRAIPARMAAVIANGHMDHVQGKRTGNRSYPALETGSNAPAGASAEPFVSHCDSADARKTARADKHQSFVQDCGGVCRSAGYTVFGPAGILPAAEDGRRRLLPVILQRHAMAKNLYVGNMAFSTTEDQLREVFSQYGTVTKVQLIMDRETGRPRGFAFVEMSDGGDQAIAAHERGAARRPHPDRQRGQAARGSPAVAAVAAGTAVAVVAAAVATAVVAVAAVVWRWRRRPSLLVQPEVFLQPRRESPGLFRSMAADFRLSCGCGR